MAPNIEDTYHECLAHACSNELEIISSHTCYCFSCGKSFPARRVSAWYIDESNDLSAACPECGLRSVVGDFTEIDLSDEAFAEIHEYHRANQSALERKSALEAFCAHFYDNKFEDTERFELLYQIYLSELYVTFHQPMACLALARLYGHGLQHTPADVEKAINFYKDPCLAADSTAIFELGLCYDAREERGDGRRAFECFSKSAALGSLSASIAIANYYLQGKYVKQDTAFALNLLLSIYGEMYPKALVNLPNIAEFATVANTIALCFRDGIGCKKNHFRELRYLLLATYFGDLVSERYGVNLSWMEEANQRIDNLAVDEFPPSSDTIIFDEDTFFDTFYEQYDYFSSKSIESFQYDGDVLVFRMSSNRPILVVDTANTLIEGFGEIEWRIQGAKLTYQNKTMTTFERIEFDGEEAVSFYHDDPVIGEILVYTIVFPELRETSEDTEAE